jgi:hypothetical protein
LRFSQTQHIFFLSALFHLFLDDRGVGVLPKGVRGYPRAMLAVPVLVWQKKKAKASECLDFFFCIFEFSTFTETERAYN